MWCKGEEKGRVNNKWEASNVNKRKYTACGKREDNSIWEGTKKKLASESRKKQS